MLESLLELDEIRQAVQCRTVGILSTSAQSVCEDRGLRRQRELRDCGVRHVFPVRKLKGCGLNSSSSVPA